MRNRRIIFTEKSKDTPLMLNRTVLEGIIEETLGLPNRYMTRAREDLMYEAYNEKSDPIIESEDPYQKAVEDEQLEDGQGEIDRVQMPTLSSMREEYNKEWDAQVWSALNNRGNSGERRIYVDEEAIDVQEEYNRKRKMGFKKNQRKLEKAR